MEIKLWPDQQYESTKQANTADILSLALAWQVPLNTIFNVAKRIYPVIKLYDSSGGELPRDSEIAVAVRRKGQLNPVYVASFYYAQGFVDLTTSEQRNIQNQATLGVDLGTKVMLTEESYLEIYLKSSSAVDWSQANSYLEVSVDEQRG